MWAVGPALDSDFRVVFLSLLLWVPIRRDVYFPVLIEGLLCGSLLLGLQEPMIPRACPWRGARLPRTPHQTCFLWDDTENPGQASASSQVLRGRWAALYMAAHKGGTTSRAFVKYTCWLFSQQMAVFVQGFTASSAGSEDVIKSPAGTCPEWEPLPRFRACSLVVQVWKEIFFI